MEILKNIKLTFRSLSKNKAVSVLNLVGLTVGLTVSMLIFLFFLKEKNTDRFIPGIDNIYVLTNNNDVDLSQSMANHIKKEIAEMDAVTYCSNDWSSQIFLQRNNESYQVKKMLTADSCFFRVFNFKPVWGNTATALNSADKIVITRSLSKKIFGKENPVGKTVTYNATNLQGQLLEVTAVIEDLPQSSSWDFEAVLSFQTNYHINWYVDNLKNWGSGNYNTFAKINPKVPEKSVADKLAHINLDAVPDNFKNNTHYEMYPFKEAYSNLPELTIIKHGNRFTLSVIGIVGLLILLLSCVNYINMVTAQREKRYKNIGIYKTMGSSRGKILQMTVTESTLLLLAALIFSLIASYVLLPGLNLLTGSKFSVIQLFTGNFPFVILAIVGIMILFTGIIPGYIFGQKPVTLLIRKNQSRKANNNTRNSLLVFQFVASIALIASILVINRQNSYRQNHNVGFARENIVYANTNDDIYDHADAFKNELKQIAGVSDFTFSQNVLIDNNQNRRVALFNKGEESGVHFSNLLVAPNFFDFFGIKLNEGKEFNEHSNTNKDVIINQTAKADFKIGDINDSRMQLGDAGDASKGNIIGVVNDFNFESMHVPIRAAAYMCSGDCDDVLYMKVNTQNIAAFNNTMKEVKQMWNRISPDFPLEYQFLDQTYAAMYVKDAQFQKFLLYTTLVSLILSCLGLVGLTFFVMEQRTKEIGIRKVNGAKISEILAMLNKDFVKWVIVAFIVATPIAWYAMHKWLESFAYKTNLRWWIFALAGLLALGIALLTVSFQSWKAATKNPVESLRYE